MNDFELKYTGHGICCRGCGRQDKQLNSYDWLADIPGNNETTDLVEVQFKNTRKAYFHNSYGLELAKGDIVAVEASPGHDIGTVTLTGKLVPLQMKKANLKAGTEIRRIYRKARPTDMEKYEEAKSREHGTMIESRQIAQRLGLDMKIGDVEYQGDGNKAIFYYIADGRVDFRQLIKVLAEAFHVRIEMKQIGARQEAGRIGGIGPCGRELCCATWMKSFNSVSTTAARFQDLSLNPQKLAGQCAKLKCCLNYEVDNYVEAARRLPSKEVSLITQDNEYFVFKIDILSGMITYSTDKNFAANLVTISARRAFSIINMNRRGEKPESLVEDGNAAENTPSDLLDQDITRFDRRKKKNGKRRNDKRDNNRREGGRSREQACEQAPNNTNNQSNNSAEQAASEDGVRQNANRNNREDSREVKNGGEQTNRRNGQGNRENNRGNGQNNRGNGQNNGQNNRQNNRRDNRRDNRQQQDGQQSQQQGLQQGERNNTNHHSERSEHNDAPRRNNDNRFKKRNNAENNNENNER